MLSLIVARAQNGAIGRGGVMPWDLPEDLAFFQRETRGGAVIMGRRTWDSLPRQVRPLKGRLNIIVSRDAGISEHVVSSPMEAVALALRAGYRRIYGIGGSSIYEALLPHADRLLITEVGLSVDDADTFFPEIEASEWRGVGTTVLKSSGPRCVAHEFLRVGSA